MNEIELRKDGFYILEFNENLEKSEWIKIDQPFWYYYNHQLILEEEITFGEVFLNLEPYLEKLEEHFLAETKGCPMKDWFDEMKKKKTNSEHHFSEIRFYWEADAFSIFDRKTSQYENSLDIYLTFSAIESKGDNEEKYGISFMNFQNFRDVPIALTKDCSIKVFNRETKEYKTLFEFEKEISLREFIACLFNEITFFGSPKTTKEEFEKLENRIETSKKDDRNDETKFIPFYKIQLEWLEKELEEALSQENFEWAENVTKEIKKVKNEK
ncbi:hypothetical protein [Flavobacterium sp.]|uniref:hypothetical protein n=1 Tax=Flavobacterium sp. TaxID=239 RepID=UPI0039E4202E